MAECRDAAAHKGVLDLLKLLANSLLVLQPLDFHTVHLQSRSFALRTAAAASQQERTAHARSHVVVNG